ncbi:hypothetical protein [Streptomyces sp. or20]|uniref:DinB/UmuC family translesion DNA polymerase n=1 Tax=Streptomyces sp. or20 TaxID=1828016 RepID=UPI00211D80AC|nr:hypothetical protein [Streptomyces sp. or20]
MRPHTSRTPPHRGTRRGERVPAAAAGPGAARRRPTTVRLLVQHGVHTVGDLAGLPLATVQRLLGARTGRTLHDRAHGHDHRPVLTEPVARSTSTEHRFTRDELDPAHHRRALLHLAGQLGARLRTDAQVAAGLTITIRYADGATTTRTLPETTHHTRLLAHSAYDLYETLGLQRARVRNITLRGENLSPTEHATRQLTFDHTIDKTLLIEAVQDRARRRYGADVIRPATLAAVKQTASCPCCARSSGDGRSEEEAFRVHLQPAGISVDHGNRPEGDRTGDAR